MKATHFELPPDAEAIVQRVNIGGGQEQYTAIPAVVFPDPAYPGFNSFLSRWVPEDGERMALGRSAMRAALLAFAAWVAAIDCPHDAAHATMPELIQQFLAAHPDTFGGPDADLWYQRLMHVDDKQGYQPMRMEVCAGPPIELVEADPPPLPGPRLVQ